MQKTIMDFAEHAIMWGLAGLVLLVLEMFTNTFFALFCGIACLITAALTHFFFDDLNVLYQWISFIVFSVLLVVAFMKPLKKKFGNASVKSNFEDHIGKRVKVINTIGSNTAGKVIYKGAEWMARSSGSEEIEAGTEAEIVAVDGINLIVKK